MTEIPFILADGRWQGQHGIGRFSTEVLARLKNTHFLTAGPKPLSLQNFFWQNYQLGRQLPYRVFFTPGFNAPLFSSIPFTFTIHDLIHLEASPSLKTIHRIFYERIVKPAIKKAHAVFTVSQYSKQAILNWVDVPAKKIIHVSAGISAIFKAHGSIYKPGFPYLLHVGNASKPHKNVDNLLMAFAQAKIDKDIKLIFTGSLIKSTLEMLKKQDLMDRIAVHSHLSEAELATYYRGALGVLFPSSYEGFGLPLVESMASGIPVLTSNTTSLPEVAGDAAILIDPWDIEAISHGIEQLISDTILRKQLIEKGLARSQLFSWDKTAEQIQNVLHDVCTKAI